MADTKSELVIIDNFNSEIIRSVFGWASAFISTLVNDGDNLDVETVDVFGFALSGVVIEIMSQNSTLQKKEKMFLNTCLYKFELDIFKQAVNEKKLNAFELVKAADFWDMPRLTSSLALYIVNEITELHLDNDLIYSTLFQSKFFFPEDFAQRVLYLLLLQRHARSSAFFNVWSNVNTVYVQRLINFDDFLYLYSIENEFIKHEPQNEQLMTRISYREVGFNLKILQKLKFLMALYLDKEDLIQSIVAGGIFWDYKIDSPFATLYPLLFKSYKSKQDVDIFILDNEEHEKYKSYILKMKLSFNKTIEESAIFVASGNLYVTQDDTDYEIYSFKMVETDGFILNFVFINKSIYSSLSNMVLETFDYSIAKTYYSYKNDALYVPAEIFDQYEGMCHKFGVASKREDVMSLTNSCKFFKYYNRLLHDLVRIDLSHTDKEKKHMTQFLDIKKQEFSFGFQNYFNDVSKFLRRILPRILKYSFKNVFVNEGDHCLVLQRINLYYEVFNIHLEDRFFEYTHDDIVECIFLYVLKKNNLRSTLSD